MTAFVALAALMTIAAMAIVLLALKVPPRGDIVERAAVNAALLRQQLHELALERERGALDAAGFAALRDDLQRRVLADATPAAESAPPRVRWPLAVAAVLIPVLAAAVYAAVGSPAALERGATASIAELEAHVAAAPGDARAWVLLARLRMDADEFSAAAAAYQRALDASGKVAGDPQVWAEYADALGMAQGGTLAGAPRAAIERALVLDANHPQALELAGSAAYEARDFRAAHAYWSALLAQLPESSPQRAALQAAVENIERSARRAALSPQAN